MEPIKFPTHAVHIRRESAAPFEVGVDTQVFDPELDATLYVRAAVDGRWLTWRGAGDDNKSFGLFVHEHPELFIQYGLGTTFMVSIDDSDMASVWRDSEKRSIQ